MFNKIKVYKKDKNGSVKLTYKLNKAAIVASGPSAKLEWTNNWDLDFNVMDMDAKLLQVPGKNVEGATSLLKTFDFILFKPNHQKSKLKTKILKHSTTKKHIELGNNIELKIDNFDFFDRAYPGLKKALETKFALLMENTAAGLTAKKKFSKIVVDVLKLKQKQKPNLKTNSVVITIPTKGINSINYDSMTEGFQWLIDIINGERIKPTNIKLSIGYGTKGKKVEVDNPISIN